MRNKGLTPWRKFVQQMREQDHRAGEFQDHRLLRGAFLSWRSTTVVRVEKKEAKADGVHHMALLRHAMRAWKQVRWYHYGISLLILIKKCSPALNFI